MVLSGEGQRPQRPAGWRGKKHQELPGANEVVARPGSEPREAVHLQFPASLV